ncbi:MAG: cytochrome P450 [Nitrospira sp.]
MPDSVPSFTLVDVPGAVPLLGHLGAFKKRPLQMLSTWWQQHGNALRFRLGPKTLHLFSHPDLAEEILIQQSDRFVKVYDPRRPTGLRTGAGQWPSHQFGRGLEAPPADHPTHLSPLPNGGDGRSDGPGG